MAIDPPACATETGTWCQRVWDTFQVEWLAAAADTILQILIVVLIALVARWIIFRAINKLTKLSTGKLPTVFGTMQEHAEQRLLGPQSAARKESRSKSIGSLLKSITSFVIVIVTLMLILAELGINVAPLLASAGIAGIALGFGAQNLVKDFLAGVSMILEDQYGIGDQVDLGPASGTVISNGLRTTAIRGGDGTIWYVRNGEITRVGNSSQGEAVVTIDLPLPYTADAESAGRIALEAADRVTRSETFAEAVTVAPALQGIVDMDTTTVTIRIVASVRAGQQWAFSRAARSAIKIAFDAANIQSSRGPETPAVNGPIDNEAT